MKIFQRLFNWFRRKKIEPGEMGFYAPINKMENVATCFFTGKTNNLSLYPLKNKNDQLIGFLFVDPKKHFKDLTVNWDWKEQDNSSILNVKTYA